MSRNIVLLELIGWRIWKPISYAPCAHPKNGAFVFTRWLRMVRVETMNTTEFWSQDICPSWILFLKGLINLTFRILSHFRSSWLQTSLLKYLPVMSNEKLKRKRFLKVSLASGRKALKLCRVMRPVTPMSCLKIFQGKPWGQAIQRKDWKAWSQRAPIQPGG